MKPVVSALLYRLTQIDLRGLLLVSGLGLALFSLRSDLVSLTDFRLFQLSSYLVTAPKGSSEIGIISLPSAEVKSWHEDIHSAGKLGALLSNILHASSSTVGLLLEQPLNLGKSGSDLLLEDLIEHAKDSSEAVHKAKELVQRREFLLEFLRNERVIIGVEGSMPVGQTPIDVISGKLQDWPEIIRYWWWPTTYENPLVESQTAPRPLVDHYPNLRENRFQERQLVVGDARTHLYPGFFSQFLYSLEKQVNPEGARQFLWQEDKGLIYGSQQLAASPEGKFIAFNRATERMRPRIIAISPEDAFARGAFPKYVFVASENNPWVKGIATDLYSVLNNNTLHKPWWHPVLERGLLLFFTLYLCFLLPRLSRKTGVVLSLFLAFVVVVVQVVLAAIYHWSLPMMLIVFWLGFGHITIFVWLQKRTKWQRVSDRADNAVLTQADLYIEKGQYLKAQVILTECETRKEVLQKLYEVANGFSEKRQYQSAVNVLNLIAQRQKGYKDTEQKIEALKAMVATQPKTVPKKPKVDTTMILDMPKVTRPRLGRYKIEEELGRGAMGVVYLGFDPKISRRVAIKTFNYSQFQPQQIDDLKSRFFREAEAAGRLNHPNIVSVFDVGEEKDLAYIAMDFANGKPLSAFTSEACLLPVFEVYRIICDVSQALEYAHDNQIVHRDIKPGNIMYNPSPYKIKVTDFGIARLVDDSRTSTGEILGSPLYMSPEQLKGKKVSGTSDIFSLGVTFYQLLTGALPFFGENLAALTYEIIHGKHKGARTVRKDLPVSASRIINQCLQKAPEDRYATAGELALVLKKAMKRDFPQAAKKVGYL